MRRLPARGRRSVDRQGRYRAHPSKRVWIDKPDGRQRPIGITALEDKIVQKCLVWVLEQNGAVGSYGERKLVTGDGVACIIGCG
jgi:hypothetical protein